MKNIKPIFAVPAIFFLVVILIVTIQLKQSYNTAQTIETAEPVTNFSEKQEFNFQKGQILILAPSNYVIKNKTCYFMGTYTTEKNTDGFTIKCYYDTHVMQNNNKEYYPLNESENCFTFKIVNNKVVSYPQLSENDFLNSYF